MVGVQPNVCRRASLLFSAELSSSLPFSLSTSPPYVAKTLLSASLPPSLIFPVLAFASVKTKTYSRAGTDAKVLLKDAMYLAFCSSTASLVGAWATTYVMKIDLIKSRTFRKRALTYLIAMPSLQAFLTTSSFFAPVQPHLDVSSL